MAEHPIDYVEAIADAFPDDIALIFRGREGTNRRFTYRELDERLNRTVAVLKAMGIRAGDHVGCHLYDTPAHVDLMLGAWKMGAVPINVNYRYLGDELRHLFADSDVKLVMSEPDLLERARASAKDIAGLTQVIEAGDAWERRLAEVSPARPAITRTGDEHYILYTGGTTGLPKGVVWRIQDIMCSSFGIAPIPMLNVPPADSPEAVVGHLRMANPPMAALRTTLALMPLMHGAGQWMLMRGLLRGGHVVLISDSHFDASFMLKVVAEEGVNVVVGAGDAHARPVLDAIQVEHGGKLDLPKLLLWGTGSVMLAPSIKEGLMAALPGTFVYDSLGASESGGQGTAAGYSAEGSPRFALEEGHVIVDDDLKIIPKSDRRIGKLAKTGHIPLGYYKDEAKTVETFVTIDGIRYSIPGDLARWEEDGTATLFGRGSVSINTGGEKVFPEEVEKALKSHPDVFDAVVVGTPDPRWGSKVTAVVQLRPGRENPGLEALATHVKAQLAGYKAPRALVIEETIVRSPSGKPDYRWAKAAAMRALS